MNIRVYEIFHSTICVPEISKNKKKYSKKREKGDTIFIEFKRRRREFFGFVCFKSQVLISNQPGWNVFSSLWLDSRILFFSNSSNINKNYVKYILDMFL